MTWFDLFVLATLAFATGLIGCRWHATIIELKKIYREYAPTQWLDTWQSMELSRLSNKAFTQGLFCLVGSATAALYISCLI